LQAPNFSSFVGETKKCSRCELRYSAKKETCNHCENLTEQGLIELKNKVKKEQIDNRHVGQLLLYASIILLIVTILISM